MERLTEYIGEGEYRVAKPKGSIMVNAQKCFEKLARYEDTEENGLLVRLPCKIGDCLYSIALGKVTKHKVYGCRYNGNDVFLLWVPGEFRVDGIPAKSIGKTVFLTKEEAEAKLKEMEGENADNCNDTKSTK